MNDDTSPDLRIPDDGVLHFAFEGAQLRTATSDEGESLFAAVDVCALLDHSNPRRAVRSLLDDDEWTTVSAGRVERNWIMLPNSPSFGGPNEYVMVNESGLWGLLLASRVPGARRIRKWLTSEVLPAIRRRGMYATPADELRGS